jgi:lipopolysaccharide biosynthesis protein
MLRATPEVGVVGPTELRRVTSTAACAEREAELGGALAILHRRIGLGDDIHRLEHFTGGNFWIRVRALDAIRDLNLSDADFEILSENEAALQAAAIELLFCRSVCQSGYRISDISGADIGRTPSIGRDVAASPWRDIRPLGNIAGRQVCLFASFLPTGRFAESTLYYMRQIKRAGFYLHALAAVPDVAAAVVAPDESAADAFSIRQNEGHDFAIWAAALRRHPELLAAEELLFANDSVFGPIRPFADIVARMRALDADFAAMTESNEIQRHFQSYFLHFKRSAVRSDAFKRFWLNVRSQPNKTNLIRSYEVPMLAKLESAGLRGAVLFPCQPGWGEKMRNPVIHAWAELVRAGFPFLKVQLLRDNPGHTDLLGWRTVAAANGYDVGLIEAFLAEHCPGAAALRAGA